MKKLFVLLNVFAAGALLISYSACLISPETMAWPALFGLGYPLTLASNIVFVLIWVLVSPRKALISSVVIALGLPFHLDFFSWKSTNDTEYENRLKVITYNVRLFDYYNWTGGKKTKDSIFTQLKAEEADVVCFQEFYYTEKKGVFETRDTLKRVLDLPHLHDQYSHKLTGSQYFGIATYSRYKIVNRGKIEFSTDKNNFGIYTDIVKGSDTLRVYNVHLASIRFKKEDYEVMESDTGGFKMDDGKRFVSRLMTAFEKRASQTEELINELEKSPYKIVLAGDFNDTPISYCYQRFEDYLDDAFKGAGSGISNTYIGKFPSFRIDYILHSPELKAVEYKKLPEKLSDHHAVEAVLAW